MGISTDQELTPTEQTLEERGHTHGDFRDNARVSQALKQVMRDTPNWHKLPDHRKEALEMQCLKLGRLLTGDCEYQDHWDDLAGYPQLARPAS